MPQLVYTEKVVKEVMRLYPPAWAVARTVAKECEVAGYLLPLGANVVVSPWVMHRDERFFPDPLKFDPDRWSPDGPKLFPSTPISPLAQGRADVSDNPSP